MALLSVACCASIFSVIDPPPMSTFAPAVPVTAACMSFFVPLHYSVTALRPLIFTGAHALLQSHRTVTRVKSISSPGLFAFLVLISMGIAASTMPFCDEVLVLGTVFWCYNVDEVCVRAIDCIWIVRLKELQSRVQR